MALCQYFFSFVAITRKFFQPIIALSCSPNILPILGKKQRILWKFHFLRKNQRQFNFSLNFILCYILIERTYDISFLFQWKLKFYTFWFKGALTLWIHWGRHMVRKGAFYFSENPFFSKKWILAPKRRLFDFSALTMSEMEKAPYFWSRTNRVCLKSAFSLF